MSEFRPIALSGYPGSGKTTISEVLAEHGFELYSGSSILRSLAEEAGYASSGSRDGFIDFWREVSKERGRDWLSQTAIDQARGNPFVFDGLRIREDAETLLGHDTLVVFIDFDPVETLKKINHRRRSDDCGMQNLSGLLARLEIENRGDPFDQSFIRGVSSIVIPAIPFIDNPDERITQLDLSARTIVDLARI